MTESKLNQELSEALWNKRNEVDESMIELFEEVCLRWIGKAIEETSGYRTDVEYVSGSTKEEFFEKYNL